MEKHRREFQCGFGSALSQVDYHGLLQQFNNIDIQCLSGFI